MINIGGDPNDASYRYKMPRLITKIEGRGNGIKTLVVNMVDVAKALKVAPQYTTKYFGFELGAQSKFEKKTDRAVVNGAHNAADLNIILQKFIDGFVLCQRCGLPELNMSIEAKKEKITADCASCGWSGPLGTGHRLVAFIVKHPTGAKNNSNKTETKEERKERKRRERERLQKLSNSTTPQPSSERSSSEVEWHTDPSREASLARKEEEMKSMSAGRALAADDDEGSSKSKKPKPKRGAKASPPDILREMLANEDTTVSELTAEVRRLEMARGFDRQKRLKIIFEAIFDAFDAKQIVAQIQRHRQFLAKYTAEGPQARLFINCFEELVGVTNPQLLKRAPIILQQFYESDVLEEEHIIEWYEASLESSWFVDQTTAQEIKDACKPIVEWLQNADSDEESEEED